MADASDQTTPPRRVQSREERTLRVLYVMARTQADQCHGGLNQTRAKWALDEIERLINDCAVEELANGR